MYSVKGRVGASDTGPDGTMTLVGILNKMQDVSMFWLESEPDFVNFLIKNDVRMLLINRQADIIRLPSYGEEFTVTTSIYECKSYFGYRNTILYDKAGNPCVLTWSTGAFCSLLTGKMARVPDGILNTITLDSKVHMIYLDKKIKIPKISGQKYNPIPVKNSFIDLNLHVNNARYVDTAVDLLPPEIKISRLRVEYKKAAKMGDSLYPTVWAENDRLYVMLADNQDNPFATMEFATSP